jgi:serine/threonine protein kinase
MARVWEADDEVLTRSVAVKLLHPHLVADESFVARFRAEAVSAARLAHPAIVSIYDTWSGDGTEAIVMELVAGTTLRHLIEVRAPLAVDEAVVIADHVAAALEAAHRAGIVHRDIKPANVLTNDYGWPALTDFGISSAVEELPIHTTTTGRLDEESTGSTESQSVGMSVPWSPPEMFGDDPDPDVRSDLFSLAATIWTLLAGRTPFEVPKRPNGTLDLIGRIRRRRLICRLRLIVVGRLVLLTAGAASGRCTDCCANDEPPPS